jgi:hypothetical protein
MCKRRSGSIYGYTGLHRGGLHERQKDHGASILIFIVDYIGEVNQLFFLLEAQCKLPCDAWKPAILHQIKRWYTCPKKGSCLE